MHCLYRGISTAGSQRYDIFRSCGRREQAGSWIQALDTGSWSCARLHCDNAQNFESKVVKHLCKVSVIKQTQTTPYHLTGNGLAECFNQNLESHNCKHLGENSIDCVNHALDVYCIIE